MKVDEALGIVDEVIARMKVIDEAYGYGFWAIVREVLDKAQTYKWHNIIDDPSDLPTEGGNFLVYVRGDIYYTCNDCTAEKFADYVRNGNVLKWKYIEE